MTLRSNVIASYASQIYVTIISLGVMPIYLRYIGSEAYGLIGFFAMLQAWFQILDLGLGPALARDVARYRGGVLPGRDLRVLFASLEKVFVVGGVIGAVILVLASPYLASRWVKSVTLSAQTVTLSLLLMGLTVPMRWLGGLYRSVIGGFERLVWLALFNSFVATARFLGVLILFVCWRADAVIFFGFQFFVAVLELAVLYLFSKHILIDIPRLTTLTIRQILAEIKRLGKFSLAIATTATLWIVMTQADKLLLSRVLSLSEYGYFSLAIVVANGVSLLAAPISNSLLPSLSRLQAEGQHPVMLQLYRRCTQITCLVTFPCALVLALFSREVLFAWTGDPAVSQAAGRIVGFYALGNAVLALTAFPYLLQYANGKLRMHLAGNILLITFLLPSYFFVGQKYGAAGAAVVWFVAMVGYFVGWVSLSHAKLEPGLNKWWYQDIVRIAGSCIAVALIIRIFIPWPDGRPYAAITAIAILIIITLAGTLAASDPSVRLFLWRLSRRGKKILIWNENK